jgi:glucose 1-dehydrogenase
VTSDTSDERRVAIVTGAAGALGSATVEALADDGYRVIAMDRAAEQLKAATTDWEHSGRGQVVAMVVDQTDRSSVDTAVADVVHRFGRLDGVVANAGYAKFGSILDMPAAVWARHVDVNLTGTFNMLQSAARAMSTGGAGGWITVISSNLAEHHSDQVGAYCVTKAALLHLVKSAAAELGVHRIRVNAIQPGVVDTPMTHGMLEQDGVREGLVNMTPMGRLGSPRDITSLVRFLGSDEAAWISGATVLADGGQAIYGQPAWIRQNRSVPHHPTWDSGYPTVLDWTERLAGAGLLYDRT